MIDKTIRQVPLVKIHIDTPYLKGEVEAQCLPDAIYDLIIGNAEGARDTGNSDPEWGKAGAVVTRSQTKKALQPMKPLKILSQGTDTAIMKQELVRLQQADNSLKKFESMTEVKRKGEQEATFEKKRQILYRLYKNPAVNKNQVERHVLVPEVPHQRVTELAHCSVMSGHLGIEKTLERIMYKFHCPEIHGDVTQFCRSCDICQKTISKGKVTSAVRKDAIGR